MNAPELRLPPHSVESEQTLLGGLILDWRVWDQIADAVAEADFYRDDHRRIFRHIALLSASGKAWDIVALYESIQRSNEVEQTGGLAYLGDMANNTPSAATVKHHAQTVRTKAVLRRMVEVGDWIAGAAMGNMKPEALLEEAERRLATEADTVAEEPASIGDVFIDALNYIDQRGEASGLKLGFDQLDALTGGLEPGQLIVIAARPSVGKTLFACNVADRVATAGKAVLFHTLEMTKREVGMRILASRSSVSVHAMRSGVKSPEAWDRMSDMVPKVQGHRLWIDDRSAISVAYVRARARRMKRQHGLDLIVIDYLGLMEGKGDNRTQEIGSISRGLKRLAKEMQIPIIVLAQLNRGVEGRSDKRPMMSDLRDSGEIEQDADLIAFLHREELYNDSPQWQHFAELIVRKNRQGPLGEIQLHYDGKLMTFRPWAEINPRTLVGSKAMKGFRDE